ncbi:hypothetical protein [Flavobacterium silvaticum]|uniref:Uncharacterized protein n=1 Tax=Flavobacterium silvaticum TaxID=1852020 RepID=A0A972FJQ3_9FLAO|nr:hypothetical protein [Flavobacterium silvaticum]NMH27309.1 hypothetical protein [Flavobacterium silvaticum]
MNLITNYSISYQNSGYDYLVEFDMPNNCTCKKITGVGKNTIEVTLPSGQVPSPTMITKQLTFTGTATGIEVGFDQICNGISYKKPTMVVTI